MFNLANKDDIKQINGNIKTIDQQIYHLQVGLDNIRNDLEYYTKHETLKSNLSVPSKNDVDRQFEETRNEIMNLQTEITSMYKQISYLIGKDKTPDLNLDGELPNWITDSLKSNLRLENERLRKDIENALKKVRELEYANRTLQDLNRKLLQDSTKQQTKIIDLNNEIEKLQNENNKLNGINHSIGYRNAQLRINYDKKIEELEHRIKVLQTEKIDLQREIFR